MHILIIGKVWPEPASSAAGGRMLQLMETFLAQGWSVSFASAANKSDFSVLPEWPGLNGFSIDLNASSFDDFIKRIQPDLVLFDRFSTEEQYGWRVAQHCPQAMRVLDLEDLHGLRAGRENALKEHRAFSPDDLTNNIAKRELASIYRCDLSLVISSYELELLLHTLKIDPTLLHYLPFLPEALTEEHLNAWPPFAARKNFISIGNFLHGPNWDATLYMKQTIWPLIRKQLPEVELEVYGAYPSHKVFQLHTPAEGFLVRGRANAVAQVMAAARVCLAPLRFGAGLKGKLLDAMRFGTPSVTTAIGAEGMHGSLAWNGAIADSPEEFAAAAVALYKEESRWNEAQQQGALLYSRCFDTATHQKLFISTLLSLQQSLEKHRLKNFVGGILWHQSLLSTKYMALWIEAKNKIE